MEKKIFAAIVVLILLGNMLLLALRITNFMIFWLVLLACVFLGYYLLPKLRE